MSQVTIYLDHEAQKLAKRRAKEEGHSLSAWISALIKKETSSQWPAHIREMAGSWDAFPSLKEIRKKSSKDLPRKSL